MTETSKSRENGIGVWRFDTGETEWVAARSQEEAEQCYRETYEEPKYDVTEIPDLDAEEIIDLDESERGNEVYITYRELIRQAGAVPRPIASTNY